MQCLCVVCTCECGVYVWCVRVSVVCVQVFLYVKDGQVVGFCAAQAIFQVQ